MDKRASCRRMSAGFRLRGLKSMRSFFCDLRFSKPQFPQCKRQTHTKDPKGKDYTRKFGMKGLTLSHMAVLLPSSLLLLSLIKLWAREDRGVTHRQDCTRCSDLMLPGLTLVYFLRLKKQTKTLIQDKLLQPGSVTSLVLLFILEIGTELAATCLSV